MRLREARAATTPGSVPRTHYLMVWAARSKETSQKSTSAIFEMEQKRFDNNRQRLRPLLPARPEEHRFSSPTPSSSQNRVTKSACLACQKRKSRVGWWLHAEFLLTLWSFAKLIYLQCSGERPSCARCISRGASCFYDTAMPDETHNQALKRKYDEVQAMNITYKAIYGFLQAAPEADSKEVFKRIRSGIDAETITRQIREGNILLQAVRLLEESASPPCFQQLRSWKLCHPALSDNISLYEDQSTILTLPPRPLDAYRSLSAEDAWTQIGWTKAHVHHLIDAILTWDYLPFSLLCYDNFLQSFYGNSTRFCSSALVYAILAMASRLVNENNDDLEVLPSGWVGSKIFCDKAKSKLQQGSSKALPDIQAIGILSLYHLRCGQEARAQECAETFVTKISDLCKNEPLMSKGEEQYARVRNITYCGAVSLSRYV